MNGYTISNVDINQFIDISPASFDTRIHPMEKRNLDKCRKSGLVFREHPNTEAKMVFNCIRSFRKTRKVPVNIELDTLTRQIKQLPERYTFFSAALEDEMVAATICVKVTDRILYNFLPAHDSRYNMYSPMVFLLDHVYQYAQKGGYEYLDLGISSLNNAPQSGLIRFKQRLGSQINTRFTFTKKIKLDD